MIVTFDVYGTLFDWEGSIGGYLRFIGVDPKRFFESEYTVVSATRGFRKYSEILREALKRTMGSSFKEDYGDGLVLAFAKSPPFPDTFLGLKALKRGGHRLGLISNTERELIRITLSGLEGLFEWVVTAEDTGHYKPSKEAFLEAYRLMGVDVWDNLVHVSSYPQYDLETASKLGIRSVLVNRYGYSWATSATNLVELAQKLSG